MARGWESKAIESQIETAQEEAVKRARTPLTREEGELRRKKDGLLLSRIHVLEDLAKARNGRYRKMLQDALAKLEKDLADLETQP
jgi:hypothetical protein